MGDDEPGRPGVIGLLGGICSGKSTVSSILRNHGAAVLEADAIAREALADPALAARLAERFGAAVQAEDGSIDRAAVSRIVFEDRTELTWLEAQVHPFVRNKILTVLAQARRPDPPAIVLDVPLLLEKDGYLDRCDLLVFVDCPREIRNQRAQHLRGWTADELDRREAHQMPLDEKRRRADVVLLNDGSEEDLARKVEEWVRSVGGLERMPLQSR